MYNINELRNKILPGHALSVLKEIPDNSVDLFITSSPYLWLRSYNTEPQIWDDHRNCEHDFSIDAISCSDLRFRGKHSYVGNNISGNIYNGSKCKSNYCRKCNAWLGELGQELLIADFIRHLTQIFLEAKRILKKTGSIYINIGDSASKSGGSGHDPIKHTQFGKYIDAGTGQKPHQAFELPPKCECSIPERLKLSLIDNGLICRRSIIWEKCNPVPQSASDNFTNQIEYIYFFVKSSDNQYYTNIKTLLATKTIPPGIKGIEGIDWQWGKCEFCNTDNKQQTLEVQEEKVCSRCEGLGKYKKSLWQSHDYYFNRQFEPIAETTIERAKGDYRSKKSVNGIHAGMSNTNCKIYSKKILDKNITMRNMRNVWSIPTRSLKAEHYAPYPEQLIEIPIDASCPREICSKCGIPFTPIYIDTKQVGIAKCRCNAPTTRGIVLDPFMGSGSTAVVAKKMGCDFIGIDLNLDYIKIARKRIDEIPISLDRF